MWYGRCQKLQFLNQLEGKVCFFSTIAMTYLQLPIKAKQLVEQVNWTGSEVAFSLTTLLALASLIFILTIGQIFFLAFNQA